MRHARVRHATASDAPEMHAIYTHYVDGSSVTLGLATLAAGDIGAMHAWLGGRSDAHPVYVAELGGEVVAWASLSRWAAGSDCDRTTEVGVYVREGHRGFGLARLLLATLISRARELGHHALVSSVPADRIGTISLHRSLGFEEVGRLEEVASKEGRWVDVVYFELLLDDGALSGDLVV